MDKVYLYDKNEIDYVKSKDERMAKLIDAVGDIERSVKPDFFTAVVDTIIAQLISIPAHKTIRKRINEKFGELTPEKVMEISADELHSVGISMKKAVYIKNFAENIVNKKFDIDALDNMTDEDAIKYMITLDGVGQWTAEMLLTTALQRPDIISYGDLSIRKGIMRLYNLDELSKEKFHELTDKFSPYRTIAARYLWRYADPKCEIVID